jgi:hypothetical protein
VVIDDLDIVRTGFTPSKTNSPLVVDPDAVLSRAIAFEQFQSVARRNFQIVKSPGDLKLSQFTSTDGRNICKSLDAITVSKGFSVAAPERSDHIQ